MDAFPSLGAEKERLQASHGIDLEASFRDWMTQLMGSRARAEEVIAAAAEKPKLETLAEQKSDLGLTMRERIAVYWLSMGHRNEAIAEHMGCSMETVKSYLRRGREKLDMKGATRELVVAEMIRRGAIP